MTDNETQKQSADEKLILENEWLIRPCEVYEDEYSECRGLKDRFHQYFVYGKTVDCSQWKRDLDNCYKWQDKNLKAAKEIIESEKQRRLQRLKAHYSNDVWEKRSKPPEDWSKPLPEYMQKEYENSYLDIKNREMKGEIEPTIDSRCIIM